MANVKISQLASAATLTGTEEVAVVQSNATVKTTAQDIANLGGVNLEITADGSIAGPHNFYVNVRLPVSANTTGTNTFSAEFGTNVEINMTSNQVVGTWTATTVEFPSVTFLGSLAINYTPTLESLSAPLLKQMSGNLDFQNNQFLTDLYFPELENVEMVIFGQTPALTNINFNKLIKGNLSLGSMLANLTGFRQTMFPDLRTSGFFLGYNYVPSFEIDFPLLTTLTTINGSSSVQLSKINLPALINVPDQLNVQNFYGLSIVNIGTVGITKKWGNPSVNAAFVAFINCGLDQASIDNILLVLASLDGTNGTTISNNGYIALQGGTNATPSAAGQSAITVLQNRGFSVAYNF